MGSIESSWRSLDVAVIGGGIGNTSFSLYSRDLYANVHKGVLLLLHPYGKLATK